MSKNDTITQLRKHLSRLFDSRYAGVTGEKHSWERGYADGYLRAVEDLEILDGQELLAVIGEERRNAADRADTALATIPQGPSLVGYA